MSNMVKLNLEERFLLGTILPQKGTVVDLKDIRILREDLAPTTEEVEATGARDITELTKERAHKAVKEFDWTDNQFNVIKRNIKEVEKAGELVDGLLDFFEGHIV